MDIKGTASDLGWKDEMRQFAAEDPVFLMNPYSTRRRDGGIVPTGQLDKISAIPLMFREAVHGGSALSL